MAITSPKSRTEKPDLIEEKHAKAKLAREELVEESVRSGLVDKDVQVKALNVYGNKFRVNIYKKIPSKDSVLDTTSIVDSRFIEVPL